jgi:hypothetical protein
MTFALAVLLSIAPWTGSNYQTASTQAVTYRLKVEGAPNATLRLRAVGVANGWLAAFCTRKLCSPQHADVTLPSSGSAVLQFELVRESDDAAARSGATITDGAGASVTVSP